MLHAESVISTAAVLARPSFRDSAFAAMGAAVTLIGDALLAQRWWRNVSRLLIGNTLSPILMHCCWSGLGAAAVLAQPTFRECMSMTAGASAVWLGRLVSLAARKAWQDTTKTSDHAALRKEFVVSSVAELRKAIPAGPSGSCLSDALKVRDHLDVQMQKFIAQAPFAQLATADLSGLPFVSPKGDRPGFAEVVCKAGKGVALRIPDRPGNKLLFGMQNIVAGSGTVGILFVVPDNQTTLRCGGRAFLSRDPDLLERHAACGCKATMIIHIDIEYAFFHCSKAYIRSELWKPDTWPSMEDKLTVSFGPYFYGDREKQTWLDDRIEEHYQEVREAVAGRANEKV